MVRIGIDVPIADFGKNRARVEVAQSERELEQQLVTQERVNFEQQILLQVRRIELLRSQVAIAERAYEVGRQSENLTRNRYYIGKIGVTDLNLAIRDQEAARRSYVAALQTFWVAYYDLRRATLYDCLTGTPLVSDN